MRKPSLFYRLLENLLPPDIHHLIGDMEEDYNFKRKKIGVFQARLWFWLQLLHSVPLFIIQSLIWNSQMILNYLKVSWRTLQKYIGFSFINVFGLAASMSVCLLIILFITDQLGYDRFHEKGDRIVRVISVFNVSGNSTNSLYATSPASLGNLLQEKYPEVEEVISISRNFGGDFRHKNNVLPIDGFFANQSFLNEFTFELIKGDPSTALKAPGSIILTPSSAKKLFADENPIGKTIQGLGSRDYTVTGVINDDVSTHFEFEAIASYSTLTANTQSQANLDNWRESVFSSMNYLVIKPDADLENLEANIQSLIQSNYTDIDGENLINAFQIQPLTKINLGLALSNEIGFILPNFIVWFLLAFGTIIILIAVFNYMSLTIARSLSRGKEVGVRKVLGAYRSGIIKQFLIEALMFAGISVFIASVLLQWIIPAFNKLFFVSFSNSQVDASLLFSPQILLSFLAFTLIIGVLAGIYPSLYLSSFNPAKVIKGINHATGGSSQRLKKMITISQFTVSIIFITTSLILVQQFNHIANADYGYQREHIVNVSLQDIPYNIFKQKLDQNSDIESYAATSSIPALGSSQSVWIETDSLEENLNTHIFQVDENYISTMDIELLTGRNFNPESGTDSSSAILLSDKAILHLGLRSPDNAIGKEVVISDTPYTIIGVFKSFISADAWRAGDSIALFYDPGSVNYAVVKVKPNRADSFIAGLKTTWLSLNSLHSLRYDIFENQIQNTPQLSVLIDLIKILALVGGFTIFISCLGLLGLAIYSTENRVKEIGVRKVLGASSQSIVFLLSKEYLLLISIGLFIGVPASWFINSLWMQVITNKVPVHPGLFAVSIALTLTLALLTIGIQTVRAARTDTVKNLRSE